MNYNIFQNYGNKTNDITVGIVLVVVLMAILVNVKPNYFKYLFKSVLGNLIIAIIIIVIGIFDVKWGIGFAAIAFIIYQAFKISCIEGFSCKSGCVAPTEPTGNCKLSDDKKTLICPWECSTDPDNYGLYNYSHGSANCVYDSECSGCGNNVFDTSESSSSMSDSSGSDSSGSASSGSDSSGSASSGSASSGSASSGSSGSASTSKPETGVVNGATYWGLFPEGYPFPKTNIWPSDVVADFINFQKSRNPNLRFDLDIIQQQASVNEVQTLLNTGKWPWSQNVINLYIDAISQNNIINNEPGASLNNAQSVYNQAAIVELLSWNTKEGSFLLNGAIIKHTDGMPDNVNNLIRCGKDSKSGDVTMQKIVYTGYDGINGSLSSQVTTVKNSDIPKLLNGFKFLNSECNPCSAVSDPADYSCPFSLNVGNGTQVSDVWQQLWGLNSPGDTTNGIKKTDSLSPDIIDMGSINSFNKDDFPLLNELKDELMKGVSYVNVSFAKPKESMSNIGFITESNIPPILTNNSKSNNIYYGTKNSF
jgi:uncharacterized membrane protein YgcG